MKDTMRAAYRTWIDFGPATGSSVGSRRPGKTADENLQWKSAAVTARSSPANSRSDPREKLVDSSLLAPHPRYVFPGARHTISKTSDVDIPLARSSCQPAGFPGSAKSSLVNDIVAEFAPTTLWSARS